MRQAFVRKIMEYAAADPSVMLLTGDMGFNFFEPFVAAFPKQFLNVGISEQNMAGLAAGLAREGRRVYCYSIANFPTLRCLEQIRNDICYHHADVTIVANGGGLAYGYLGMSHHATEDLSIMRALPQMTVTVPADPREVEAVMDYLRSRRGPGYLRMCRGGEPVLHEVVPLLREAAFLPLLRQAAPAVRLLVSGEIASEALRAAAKLREMGIMAAVDSAPVVKPLPELTWEAGLRLLVTVEENNCLGGLGGAVAEVLAGYGRHPRLLRIGMPDCYSAAVGKHQYLRGVYRLSADAIAERIVAALNSGSGE